MQSRRVAATINHDGGILGQEAGSLEVWGRQQVWKSGGGRKS